MKENSKTKAYVIPHTHWDREWRYPLWKNRMLLVEFFDQLLEILDNNKDYHCFLMDGQISPIEDYLEVMPQNKEKVTKHIKEGRIAVGPWYTLPDLYPVDGECLVRNLLKGIRITKKYGEPLGVGYNTFGWGQTAQLPQIYKEFGFDFIICAKKVSKDRAPDSEFWWEAPDGTKVLTSRLGEHARANLFFNSYIDVKFGVSFFGEEFKYSPQRVGSAYHIANKKKANTDYFVLDSNKGFYQEYLKEGLEKAIHATDETVVKEHRLLLNGCDFSTAHTDLTHYLDEANKVIKDVEFVNTRLEEYADKLKESVKDKELKVVKGELRDGPACDCSGNALATRIYIKQLNKKVENEIIRKAEPMAVAADMLGKKYPKHFIDKGWTYLLKSHPHDSINGVTQDKTVNDVEYRLNQALEIGEVVYEKSMAEIIKKIDTSDIEKDRQCLAIFNPIARENRDILKVCIDFPAEENIWDFDVVDENGNIIPVQKIAVKEHQFPVHDVEARPWPYKTTRHTCYIECDEIQAGGYKVFEIVPKETFHRERYYWVPMKKMNTENIAKAQNILENDFLRSEIMPNGTITLKDKERNEIFEGLHYFEDTGDVGNYWAYYAPYKNKTYTSIGQNANIWLEDEGPLSATIGVEIKMEVPKYGYEPDFGVVGESKRSEEMTDIKIISKITLKKNAKKLEVRTQIENTAENHRMRVAFPTGITATHAAASGHFTVDKRSRIPHDFGNNLYYPEMQTLPQQNFIDISDGEKGLSVVNSSFTEYEYKDDEKRTLYFTLFRSMGNMIVTGWRAINRFPEQKGSQLLQTLEYAYDIYPHEGDYGQGYVYARTEELNVPMTAIQFTPNKKGSLPKEKSFYKINNANIIVSTLKMAEDNNNYIIRLYNPTSETLEGEFTFGCPIEEVFQTNLNEERTNQIHINGDSEIPITIESNKIITFEIKVKNNEFR